MDPTLSFRKLPLRSRQWPYVRTEWSLCHCSPYLPSGPHCIWCPRKFPQVTVLPSGRYPGGLEPACPRGGGALGTPRVRWGGGGPGLSPHSWFRGPPDTCLAPLSHLPPDPLLTSKRGTRKALAPGLWTSLVLLPDSPGPSHSGPLRC